MDRIDSEIVAALQNDARLSNKELAARVGLAPSTCLGRVRRLRQDGVLRGFHADVDPKALGINLQAVISVRMAVHSTESFETMQRHMLALREVVGLFNLAGRDDFVIHVAVPDSDHLRRFMVESITSRPDVQQVETNLVFEHFPRFDWPNYRALEE